jgi:hypothetical protein
MQVSRISSNEAFFMKMMTFDDRLLVANSCMSEISTTFSQHVEHCIAALCHTVSLGFYCIERYREILTFVDWFTATGAPPAAKRI